MRQLWAVAIAGAATTGDAISGIFCLLSLFWTVQVVKNVVHVTCAGTAASWYFQTADARPAMASLKRACTTSLGSVCLGSLFVALLRAVRIGPGRIVTLYDRSSHFILYSL